MTQVKVSWLTSKLFCNSNFRWFLWCATGIVEIQNDGSPWRPLIRCRNMARAFQLFIERDLIEVSGKPVIVGFTLENFHVKDIETGVQKAWPEGSVNYLPDSVSDPRDYKVDFSILKTIFADFEPQRSLSIGISELRSLSIQIGYSQTEHNSERYVRLNELMARIHELS